MLYNRSVKPRRAKLTEPVSKMTELVRLVPERVARLDPLPDCFARTKHTPDTDFMRDTQQDESSLSRRGTIGDTRRRRGAWRQIACDRTRCAHSTLMQCNWLRAQLHQTLEQLWSENEDNQGKKKNEPPGAGQGEASALSCRSVHMRTKQLDVVWVA